ncbi:hypothetical protein ABIB90_006319 [Bradyrhizobium sp. JR4.1]
MKLSFSTSASVFSRPSNDTASICPGRIVHRRKKLQAVTGWRRPARLIAKQMDLAATAHAKARETSLVCSLSIALLIAVSGDQSAGRSSTAFATNAVSHDGGRPAVREIISRHRVDRPWLLRFCGQRAAATDCATRLDLEWIEERHRAIPSFHAIRMCNWQCSSSVGIAARAGSDSGLGRVCLRLH